MRFPSHVTIVVCLAAVTVVGFTAVAEQPGGKPGSVFGVFEGTTPGGEAIQPLLKLPPVADLPIRWKLTLYQDAETSAPTTYELECHYQAFDSRTPDAEKHRGISKITGSWSVAKGTKANAETTVYKLKGLFSVAQIDRGVVHVLNDDRSLMVGDGGYSFTLNRSDAAETPVDPAIMNGRPSITYEIAPIAAGPDVFGVFDGRTPFAGIARELKITDDTGFKAKWRVTLYQDPETHAPTTYRIEGTLQRRGVRKGSWSILHGTRSDPKAIVYRLDAGQDRAPLHLLQGDDNVLFFMDKDLKPRVGHAEFSYTLNRRTAPPAPKS